MTMTDPIADLLTRIRNGLRAKKEQVIVPASKMKLRISEILKEEGYINDYQIVNDNKQGIITIDLKYKQGKSVIATLKRISKPGLRTYVDTDHIPRVTNGYGIAILSTTRGVMVDRQARKEHVGGEWLCSIW